jgi:hypothetical protein
MMLPHCWGYFLTELTAHTPKEQSMLRVIFCFLLAVSLLSSQSSGYGERGHQLVGAIADRRLELQNPAMSQKVKDLLDGLTLETVAVYPDSIIKKLDHNAAQNIFSQHPELSAQLISDIKDYWDANNDFPLPPPHENRHRMAHYTDVPVMGPLKYDGTGVGQTPFDIVHAIPRCIRVLQGTDTAEDQQRKIAKKVAVILLAHYLGDIHQPLHVGAEYFDFNGQPVDPTMFPQALQDTGGNDVHFRFVPPRHGRTPNLHGFWDEDAVDAGFPNNDDAANATQLANAEPTGWKLPPNVGLEDWAKAWANEILPVASAAHTPIVFQGIHTTPHGVKYFQSQIDSNTYPPLAGDTVRKAIHKAGWRLAKVLETALTP